VSYCYPLSELQLHCDESVHTLSFHPVWDELQWWYY